MAIPSWSDIVHFASGDENVTAYGRDRVGWTSTIGTTSIVQTGFVASPGSYAQSLSNDDRRFDPHYASSPYAPDVLPKVVFDKIATFAATAYSVFSGKVVDWPQTYPGFGVDQTVAIQVSDGVSDLSEAAQVSLTRPSEYTGARIQAIITAVGWPGPTDLSHGNAIVAPIKKSQGSISAWSHITDCVQAEWGELYFDTDGTLVFRDRDEIASASRSLTPQATFSDTTSLRYSDIQLANLPIVNDCTVTYGTRGKSVNFQDTTSITAYGLRSLPLTLIVNGRSAAKQYARWVVNRYKAPLSVPSQIILKPGANPTTYFPQVLGRKLSDMVTVVRTPRVNGVASTAISTNCWIRGIQHNYSDHVWQSTTFYLQEATWISGLFILDSSVLNGANVLGL